MEDLPIGTALQVELADGTDVDSCVAALIDHGSVEEVDAVKMALSERLDSGPGRRMERNDPERFARWMDIVDRLGARPLVSV